jgi:cardiolipin synthase A/B
VKPSPTPEPAELAPARPRHRRLRRVGCFFAAVMVFAVAILVDRVVDALRGRPVREVAGGTPEWAALDAASADFPSVVAAIGGTRLLPGHSVDVLTDTMLFARLERDLSSAMRSITMHIYYCEPGRLGDRLASTLAARARAGVRVLLLADGFACRRLIDSIGPALTEAGASVAVLRPPKWYALHRVQHRNHSRLVVIDGRIGYTGGYGVADEWLGVEGSAPWRDTSVRFIGPAVRDVQAAFVAAWAEATGTLIAGDAFFPASADSSQVVRDRSPEDSTFSLRGEYDDVAAGLLYSQPGIGTTPAERTFALSVAGARRTLFISNAYFVPTPLIRSSLESAARRGVDVRLLLPGPRTDVAGTRWAGRGYYGELMAAGVRIYEYQGTMMHAKTIVADGVWSVIGSMNLDNRSTRLNDEAALLVHDVRVGAALDSIFAADLGNAAAIGPERYQRRPRWQRLLEWATRLVAPLL